MHVSPLISCKLSWIYKSTTNFVSFLFWNLHFWIIFCTNWWISMVLCTCTMCYYYYPLDHHASASMVREIVDHFARQWGGGGFMG